MSWERHTMRATFNLVLALIAGLLVVALLSPAPALAQAAERSNNLRPGQRKSKISEEDFAILMRLELEAGARSDARKAPTVEALNGPPLNDREKLLQVMSRMSFGARPGEVDRILKESNWKDWATRQLDPASI